MHIVKYSIASSLIENLISLFLLCCIALFAVGAGMNVLQISSKASQAIIYELDLLL